MFALSAAATVAAFGVFAYGSVRSLALDAATTRLQSALSQIRTITKLGVVNQLTFAPRRGQQSRDHQRTA